MLDVQTYVRMHNKIVPPYTLVCGSLRLAPINLIPRNGMEQRPKYKAQVLKSGTDNTRCSVEHFAILCFKYFFKDTHEAGAFLVTAAPVEGNSSRHVFREWVSSSSCRRGNGPHKVIG